MFGTIPTFNVGVVEEEGPLGFIDTDTFHHCECIYQDLGIEIKGTYYKSGTHKIQNSINESTCLGFSVYFN